MFTLTNVIQRYNKKEFLNIKNYSFPSLGLVVIKGPNGCGKTTLLKTILGLLPYTGSIQFLNKDIKDWGSQLFEKVCYVPQFNVLFNSLTLEENLYLNNIFLNQPSKEYPHTKKLKEMSSGQKKKANLDRCSYFDFLCYILDEPTTSLDLEKKKEFCAFLEKEKQHKLIVCVTHDELLESFADEIIQMDRFLFKEQEVKFSSESQSYSVNKKRIPFKFYLHILWEEKLIAFFKLFTLTFLTLLGFLLGHMCTLSESEMEKAYLSNILNYVYIENENVSDEDVFHIYMQQDTKLDMVGYRGNFVLTMRKKNEEITLQVRDVYFSKKNTSASISDMVSEDIENIESYAIQFTSEENDLSIPIRNVDKTSKDLFSDTSGNRLDACSYVILPYTALDFFSEGFQSQLKFVISTEEVIPLGYQYIRNYSDYSELKESYFLPRILLISGIVLLGALLIYIELIQWNQKKNAISYEEKLKIFAAPSKFLFQIQMLKETCIFLFAFLLSTGIGILIMLNWIKKYTVMEMRALHLLSTPIHYEYFGISILLICILFFLQSIFIRRKS